MHKKTATDINGIRDKYIADGKTAAHKIRIYVHMGTCGIASGAQDVLSKVKQLIKDKKIKNVQVNTTGCAGICSREPLMTVVMPDKEPVIYQYLDENKTEQIFEEHIMNSHAVKEYALARGMECQLKTRVENGGSYPGEQPEDKTIPAIEDIPFFSLQEQRVMRNRGITDPNNITHYIGRDGYQGAIKALSLMSSKEVIQEVLDSGLRGRGGAGFPTGLKWKFASTEKEETKYVLCNADEGGKATLFRTEF
jgi:(2Fe-2S) ferredoxin